MGSFADDLRHALRSVRGAPAASSLIVLLLGLGVGANAAMFSVVNGVLLRPLPFPEPDRLIALCEVHETLGNACVASPPNATDWATQTRSLQAVGLARDNLVALRDGQHAFVVNGGLATPDLFAVFGVQPALGRAFHAGDMAEGRRDVVLLTDALWRDRFGADPAVLGRRILHDGESVEIAGILPPGFEVPWLEYVRIWRILPFAADDEQNRAWRGFRVYARLATGATYASAAAEVADVHRRLAEDFPDANRGYGVRIMPVHEMVVGSVRPMLLVFTGGLVLLLLVACANVASLLLTQAVARRGEFAVRIAIGASRSDLMRQMLTQAALLAAAAAVVALLFALWARRAFIALAPAGIPRLDQVHIHPAAFLAALGIGLVTALLFAILPLRGAARIEPGGVMREQGAAGGGRTRQRSRRILVVTEVAITTVLLVGAALLARSFAGLASWQPGFDSAGLLTFWAVAPAERYAEPEATALLWTTLTEALGSVPGVASVGTASAGPLFGGGDGEAEFKRAQGDESGVPLRWYDVGPSYFATLGVPLLDGRAFDETDRQGALPVAIVNQTAARMLGNDVIGTRLIRPLDDVALEIAGVVADVPPLEPGRPTAAEIYWPQLQQPRRATYFIVRTAAPVQPQLARALEQRAMEVEPDLRVLSVRSFDQLVDSRLIAPRFHAVLIGSFALLALVLATAGTYGVLAFSVSLRARDIGIRIALGAGRSRVIGSVLREGLVLVGIGAAAGLIGSLWLTRLLSSLLHGVAPTDPVAMTGVIAFLGMVGIAACIVPAWRAGRVDPVTVMRIG